jgi:glucose/mannose-6-phosphate isomerase
MRDLVATLPDQLRWAAGLELPDVAPAPEAIVAGMGGSGIAGSIAAVAAGSTGARVTVHKSYGLPGWVVPPVRPLVIAVSHSGNTEETLDALGVAADDGLPALVVATGGRAIDLAGERAWPAIIVPPGPQPRAAVGYLTGAVMRALEAAGLVPPQSAALREAAEVVERLLGRGGGPAAALADDLADALAGRAAIVYGGAGVAAVAASRWKTQINENAKAPAWWSVLPELDHNEVVGWSALPDLGRKLVGVVFLHDPGAHPRITLRARITRDLMEDTVSIAGEVHAQGASVLARVFSLIAVGDLVSVALAERAGVDPMPVTVIEELKRRLIVEGT